MNRETKTVTTPSGAVIVLHAYITGRERRALMDVFFREGLKDSEKYNLAEDMALKAIIVSIDGKKEGDAVDGKPFSVIDAILDMKNVDSKFVIKAVNDVSSEKGNEEKKA